MYKSLDKKVTYFHYLKSPYFKDFFFFFFNILQTLWGLYLCCA